MAISVISREDQAKAQDAALGRGRFLVTERLCLTRDGQLVAEDQCVDGGNLAYQPGQEIPLEEARRVGLVTEDQTEQLEAEVPATPLTAQLEASPTAKPDPAAASKSADRKKGK